MGQVDVVFSDVLMKVKAVFKSIITARAIQQEECFPGGLSKETPSFLPLSFLLFATFLYLRSEQD